LERVSRRSFLVKGSAGIAGAAAATSTGVAALAGEAGAAPLTVDELAELDQPALLRVTDAAAGEVELLVGEREVTITDKKLVAKVLRATK
jgi:hypothetical protein